MTRTIGPYQAISRLGKGGNGEVWLASGSDGRRVAVKVLLRPVKNSEPYKRFTNEIAVLQSLDTSVGVVPLLDSHLPEESDDDEPWYVMPVANRNLEELGVQDDPRQVVEIVRDIAHALTYLHSRGVSHRDIKPRNILEIDDKWCLADFGLAKFPDAEQLTTDRRQVGPAHYLAPEMLLWPREADGSAADVYSLAKTLWVMITGQRVPLPGEHRAEIEAFRLEAYLRSDRLSLLDALIEAMTRYDPAKRPPMALVAENLDLWLEPARNNKGISMDLEDFLRRAESAGASAADYDTSINKRAQDMQGALRALAERIDGVLDSNLEGTATTFSGIRMTDDGMQQELSEYSDPFVRQAEAMGHPGRSLRFQQSATFNAQEGQPKLKIWIGIYSVPPHQLCNVLAGATLYAPYVPVTRRWVEHKGAILGTPAFEDACDQLTSAVASNLQGDVEAWAVACESSSRRR